ncbi:MAG TPA: methyltransferase domain-containing protein [Conexibacter sp.]|nr:methyltransferase domain-containing protein [Conexibacter sp.]
MSGESTIERFRVAYREAVADVLPFLGEERLHAIGRHNPGWGPGRHDVPGYLRASEARYVEALATFLRSARALDGLAMLDVGGFMGAFPLALRRLGVRVTLTERYDYYEGAFDDLRAYLEAEGVEVLDVDMTMPAELPPGRRFGLVTCMALLEHLANSPRTLMDNMRAALEPDGQLLIEVPNLAYWPKRLGLLGGATVHPPLADVYRAAEPFTGHHREYTEGDVRELLTLSGFELRELVAFNYTPQSPRRPWSRLLDWPRRAVPGAREVLLARATVPAGESSRFVGPREDAYGTVKRLRWIERQVRPGERILDVGCGTGYATALPLLAAGHDVRGIDRDTQAIAYGREIARAAGLDPERLAVAEVRELDGQFDVVLVSGGLERLGEQEAGELLAAVRARLAPGGRLLVTVPNGYGWFAVEQAVWTRARLGTVLALLRLDVAIRMVKRRRVGTYVDGAHASSLDAFQLRRRLTLRALTRELDAAGFRVTARTGSVLAAGPLTHLAITGIEPWMAANARLGARHPALAASFYVVAEASPAGRATATTAPEAIDSSAASASACAT